jgi:2-polyprenyl-3-methyl-5-hydroxy-6-metoxy-1,4-benzoquinol methylase
MNCPVCFNPNAVPLLTGHDLLFESTTRSFDLRACEVCRSLFIDPQPSDDEVRSFYPENYWARDSEARILRTMEQAYCRIALRGHVAFVNHAASGLGREPGDTRILDVGCGNGLLLALLRDKGYAVSGVDFSGDAAVAARRLNGVEVRVGSLADQAFADESFDLITLFHVMEHVTEPKAVLDEVRRVLKPDGRVIVQVPNIDSLQFRIFGSRWYGLDIPRHLIDYSLDSIVRLIEGAGFGVRRVRHFNLRDNAPALASSLFPALDPVSRKIRKQRRGITESTLGSWTRHVVYSAVVFLSYPLAMFEAAIGRGATVMIEAKRR